MNAKCCTKCGLDKPSTEYYKRSDGGVCGQCKQCIKDKQNAYYKSEDYRQWYGQSRDSRIARKEKYRREAGATPRVEIARVAEEKLQLVKAKAFASKNMKKHQAHVTQWKKNRSADHYRHKYQTNHEFNLRERLRNQLKKSSKRWYGLGDLMRSALNRSGGSGQVHQVLGYTIADLRRHLERQFTKGMTWDRFTSGDIHIDHITPKSLFDLNNEQEIKACWCLSNLRPMWAKDNLTKGSKIEALV